MIIMAYKSKILITDELGRIRAKKKLNELVTLLKKGNVEPEDLFFLTKHTSRNTKSYYLHLVGDLVAAINIFVDTNKEGENLIYLLELHGSSK